VIYGLVAALGWGLADFTGAVTGRRIGSLWVVLAAQTFSAAVVTVIALAGDQALSAAGALIWWIVLNAVFSATAYITHYRALELGPLAVVSPVGATYALVGVVLAVIVLGERPSLGIIVGGVVTIVGVMLTSTDLRQVRAGTHTMPPGLPWAIVSAVGFGVGGLTLAKLSQDLGWELGLWSSRVAQLVAFVALGVLWRERQLKGRFAAKPAAIAALTVGGADLIGVLGYSIGAEAGFVIPVLIASAVFPLIAVALSVVYLHERPVPNQYVGVAMAVLGLVMVGLGTASV
jgi:drug/metabolite transporter (DMT)-like permease